MQNLYGRSGFMNLKGSLWGATAVVIVLTAGTYVFMHQESRSGAGAVLATPLGVTIQTASPDYMRRSAQPALYADGAGKALYTYEKDVAANTPTCLDACAQERPALIAPPMAKPFGNWSLVSRPDGAKQWALKGKPLYTYSKDSEIGEAKGADEDWRRAVFDPAVDFQAPDGIFLKAVADALGQGLVTEANMTIYAFDGDVKYDAATCTKQPCTDSWTPLAAPYIAHSVGDFSVVVRTDGARQWAYKGKGLYTFNGDLAAGDARGDGVDGRSAALVQKYFMPPNTGIMDVIGIGTVLASDDGKALYMREGYRYQVGGHDFRGGSRGIPAMGRAIGTAGCDAECLKEFIPYKASDDAQPSGYWQIATRNDGAKQWVYKGYAVYTYTGDKPGEVTRHKDYEVNISDSDGTSRGYDDGVPAAPVFNLLVDDGEHAPGEGAKPLALYWHVIWP